ncbi:DUF7684 family protein [Caenimonas aquaedulcis]|uniref:DUF7684 family protein n=1 Tax=Caenimonas aquaedulcis TaxID=2793270 RepID=UPI003F496E20
MSVPLYLQVPPGGALSSLDNVPSRVVVIADAPCSPFWQAEVSAWLLGIGCLYMMAWGEGCSSWDDSVDEANLEQFEYRDIPEDRFVMTTWHDGESLSEVFWCSKHNADHPTVELVRPVLLHISNDGRQKEMLDAYAEA